MSHSNGEWEPADDDEFDDEIPEEILHMEESFRERPGATIYRVPPEIYACDRNAYHPKAACIGPFFYHWRHRPALESMQVHKRKCVTKLISGHDLVEKPTMQKFWRKMKALEKTVRRKYSAPFPSLDSDRFTWMLILDGCFLLHLLLRFADGAEEIKLDEDDATIGYGRLWIWNLVRYDLLLLQNQIPFFVIQSLYELLNPKNKTNLVDCAINFFSILDPLRKQKQSKFYKPVEDVEHLLHLIYLSVLPCPQYCKSSHKTESQPWIPSATELQWAGIKFKKRKKAKGRGFLSFLDVKYSDGVIEIPKLKVHDYSLSLFRNFIAFEQCYPVTQCHITAYAVFMNLLINTEKDMRLLHLNGILIHRMAVDKDAIHFFGRLCNEVHHAHGTNYLRKLFSDVTEYHDSTWHKWRAYLFREYFRNPWSIISLIAGATALVVSIFGTIYNVASR